MISLGMGQRRVRGLMPDEYQKGADQLINYLVEQPLSHYPLLDSGSFP